MIRKCWFNIFIQTALVLLSGSCQNDIAENVTDVDGNVYPTIRIGNQVWMAENLKVTRYRNDELIPNVTDTAQWRYLPSGAYCNYDNDTANVHKYGRLYNWYAVNDIRNLAPEGWHVPTFEELKVLIAYLGDDTEAAGKMKEKGNVHWLSPNIGATNQSGFSALPGGYRYNHGGTFHTMGSNGYWWTATESFEAYAWTKRIYWDFGDVLRDFEYRSYGFSVRCVKD